MNDLLFEPDPVLKEKRLSRIWRDGALRAIRGEPFQSPWSPPPNWSNADPWSYRMYKQSKNQAWCRGYWWAVKNRVPDRQAESA